MVFRNLRPASREQLSKSFSVYMVQDGISGFRCRGDFVKSVHKNFGRKKTPNLSVRGCEGQGLLSDIVTSGFEKVYECIVERFQIIVLVAGFDLSA